MTKYRFCGILSLDLGTERWLSWSKARDWKSRNGGEPFWGSNPHLSANKKGTLQGAFFVDGRASNRAPGRRVRERADRCRWQREEGGKGEKQGVHRLNAVKENERLCFEVGLFKSLHPGNRKITRLSKDSSFFCYTERFEALRGVYFLTSLDVFFYARKIETF